MHKQISGFVTAAVIVGLLPIIAPAAHAAMIVVQSLDDNMTVDGVVTLREAVEAAYTDTSVDGSTAGSGSDMIVFAPALDGGTINLILGQFMFLSTTNITFNASSLPAGITIDAGGAFRILHSQGGCIIEFENMTLTGGSTINSGGAIYHSGGDLTLTNTVMMGNSSTGDGGAVSFSGNDLTLTNTTIAGNYSIGSGGGLYVSNQSFLTLDNSTIRNNTSDENGGGISYRGWVGQTMTLTTSRVVGNRAANYGGGIHILDGSASFTDSDIDSNSVESITTFSPIGAGMYCNDTDLTFLRTSLSYNQALSGPSPSADGFTGGIYTTEGDVTFTDCHVTGNTAASNTTGGGIYNAYSAVMPGTVDLIDTLVSANSAGAGAGFANSAIMTITDSQILDNLVGGGISNSIVGATLTITTSTISGNQSNSNGGGISNSSTASCDIYDSLISNNTSASSGGGISNIGTMTMTLGTIENNTAEVDGGGIWHTSNTLVLTDLTVKDNDANRGAGVFVSTSNTNVLIEGSTLSNNIAYVDGGGIFSLSEVDLDQCTISGNSAAFYGGGIHHGDSGVGFNGAITFRQCTVSNNTANVSGGGLVCVHTAYISGSIFSGNNGSGGIDDVTRNDDGFTSGTIASIGYNIIGDTNVSVWNPNDQTGILDPVLGPLQNNGGPTETMAVMFGSPAIDASSGTVGAFFNDQRGSGFPRAIDGSYDGTATVDVGAFEYEAPCTGLVTSNFDDFTPGTLRYEIGCAAVGDTVRFDPSLFGQTILLNGTPLDIQEDIIVDGAGLGMTVDVQGLARVIEISHNVSATFIGLTISGGVADEYPTSDGGGIFTFGALTLTDCRLTGNTSNDDGGGVASFGNGTIIMNDCYVDANHAQGDGGAISTNSGAILLIRTKVTGNTAQMNGGGIHASIGTTVSLTSCTISGNSSLSGGGCYTDTYASTALTATRTTFTGNTATTGSGGGIHTGSTLTLILSTIAENQAVGNGGGIASTGLNNYIYQCTISDNDAARGGGIMHSGTAMTMASNIISGNRSTIEAFDLYATLTSTINSVGYNIFGDVVHLGFSADPSDLTGILDPRLDILRDNGGPVETMALLFGSPAIDAGDPTQCASYTDDQRGPGYPRDLDGDDDGTAGCDIGAFETEPLTFGISLDADNVAVIRDFNTFRANGFSSQPAHGQIDSDEFIARGVSDEVTPMDYGHNGSTGDYARGVTVGGSSIGGVYSIFSSGNFALGLQPSADDFTPGEICVAYRNLTGGPITSANLDYLLGSFNRGDRSTRVSVYWAESSGCEVDPSMLTFMLIPASTIVTPPSADPLPSWTVNSFAHELTGLSIPAGGCLYLQFETSSIFGSGDWDTIALDNLSLTPNPGTSTGVDTPLFAAGQTHILGGVSPNPFNPRADVSLVVRDAQQVVVELFDLAGRRVKTLHNGWVEAEQTLNITLDGRNLSSATYLVRVRGENFNEVRRALLLK